MARLGEGIKKHEKQTIAFYRCPRLVCELANIRRKFKFAGGAEENPGSANIK
jgi:hypothetical protein